MSEKDSTDSPIRFLSDEPLSIDAGRDILFGHDSISEKLSDIIQICPTPFTIGLFGKWGAGKTSILNILIAKLASVKVAIVNFDVWKHEGDSLRRSFLVEATQQLGKTGHLKGFVLNERVSKKVKTSLKSNIVSRKLKTILFWLVGIAVIIWLIIAKYYPENLGAYFSILTSGGLVALFFTWLLQSAITTTTTVTEAEQFQDPHEFEKEFVRLGAKIKRGYRLLVIIDNLDRASHEKAAELLITVKTFLDQKECIFLIACDDEAIKEHIRQNYRIQPGQENDSLPFDADEFLRKFFNAYIRIPDIIDTELQTYTEKILESTNVAELDNTRVAQIITSAFRDNPRQIKQFVNTLLSHFLLAKSRESGDNLLITPEGTVTGHVDYLAKFLIIRQLSPRDYYEAATTGDPKDNAKLAKFLRATKLTKVNDIRPFLYLKISEEELSIPGIDKLEPALLDANDEQVTEILKSISQVPEQLASFGKYVIGLLKRNEGRKQAMHNVISSCMQAFQRLGIKLSQQYYDTVAGLLNSDEALGEELPTFKPRIIFSEILPTCNPEEREGIVKRYISLLKNFDQETELGLESMDDVRIVINELILHKDWLGESKKQLINLLSEKYHDYDTISIFRNRPQDMEDFISEQVANSYIDTFSPDDVENMQVFTQKIELFIDLQSVINVNGLQGLMKKLIELFDIENPKPYREEKEKFLAHMERIVAVFEDRIRKLPKDLLDTFVDKFIQGISATGDWSQKRIYMPVLLKLNDLYVGTKGPVIKQSVTEFFTNSNVESIKYVFDKLPGKHKKMGVIATYDQVLLVKIRSDHSVFQLLYPLAPKEIRNQWITHLIKTEHQRALTVLKEVNYIVDDKRAVVSALLTRADEVSPQDKQLLYDACNQMKCATDREQREILTGKITGLLKQTDPSLQNVGFMTFKGANYLSATTKRDIARQTIEWLRDLPPETAGQSNSIRSVMLYWDSLPPLLQQNYLDFVFDKLIKRGVNDENIDIGFEVLNKVKPKYEDGSNALYYEDIFSRCVDETNDSIKNMLIGGLNGLKPVRSNNKNRGFWIKVEELKK